jgi:uncharacterized protein YegP (UPF0339 family)
MFNLLNTPDRRTGHLTPCRGGTALAYVAAMMMKTPLVLSLALTACAVDTSAPVDNSTDDYYVDGKEDASRPGKFETFTGVDGKFYFHMIAGNGEKVLQSQAYTSMGGVAAGIASVRTNGTDASHFRVLEASDGEWYFDLIAGNGQTVATSELYVSQYNANRAVNAVVSLVTAANPAPAAPEAKFQVFRGFDGLYYFHLRATNGEIVLQSQGYTRRTSAIAGTQSVIANGVDATKYEQRETVSGEAYFVLKAANGQVIGVSETYFSESNAQRGADTVEALIADGTILEAQ